MFKKLIFLVVVFLSPLIQQDILAKNPPNEPINEQVVLLHGIARSSAHMEELEEFLSEAGYDVVNVNYPSTKFNISELIDIISHDLEKKVSSKKKVNFVGYSMGGLMVRGIINRYKYENLGRVVQIASPNHGSEVADFLEDNWLFNEIYGPAGKELRTNQDKVKNLLGNIDYELGVIAGNGTIDPISSAIIPGDDDGKVSIESTKIDGMKDHIVVFSSHTFFPSDEEAKKQVLHFLKNGEFKKEKQWWEKITEFLR